MWRPLLRWGAGVAVAGLLSIGAVQAREDARSVPTVSIAALPAEAQAVERAIREGGPFAFPKDGIVFANRERLLPPQWRGYYREYTVPTPGAVDRGGRRIVCGGPEPQAPLACYYTADHYASFRRITP
ncbi:MAG: ribonuclease N1 [Rhizobacter sp.]|nr:ribonuclease N1 [Rhizobacter sp.]